MRLRRGVLATAGLAVAASPIAAAPIELGGTITGSAGYSSNPFLSTNGSNDGGSVTLGGRVNPTFTQRTTYSETELSPFYERYEYLGNGFQPSESFGAFLSRSQTFTERLKGQGQVGYISSRNSFLSNDVLIADRIVDIGAIGARRRALSGNGSLTWQATARDAFTAQAYGEHATYSGFGLQDYDTYGGSLGWSRTLDARTRAGLRVSASHTDSKGYGVTDTVSPRVTFGRTLNSIWQFDGSLGVIFQKTKAGAFESKSTSVGFDANLCATYPLSTLCFTGARNTSASGFGGVRTETTAGVTYSRRISERSNASLSGYVAESRSQDTLLRVPRQRFASVDASYSRDISRRFAAGISGGYRYSDYRGLGTADGFTATLNLTAKLGRPR